MTRTQVQQVITKHLFTSSALIDTGCCLRDRLPPPAQARSHGWPPPSFAAARCTQQLRRRPRPPVFHITQSVSLSLTRAYVLYMTDMSIDMSMYIIDTCARIHNYVGHHMFYMSMLYMIDMSIDMSTCYMWTHVRHVMK